MQRSVHVVILQFLQGEVGLAQEYPLSHYTSVLDADLEVGTVQSSVGALQETRIKQLEVSFRQITSTNSTKNMNVRAQERDSRDLLLKNIYK